ncbi:protoporphyrinogen oxidase [Synechococcus sp. 65AY6A5]|uniref:protoporphyrinogen oxidase n=1 Tax=Synechococcus sp. 65AY6A5 TaxID=1353265 RepID=UPI000C181AF0|nr:protoporphyrinogen oxidase [Synechococcus sp. 65AY6A5]
MNPATPEPLNAEVVVIGAGISGLTLAWRLQQGLSARGGSPQAVLLAEASSRVGGCISTQSKDGYRWEEGPNSFTPTPALLNLIAEVGLTDQLVLADAKLPRYIYWEGALLPVPLSPAAALGSRLLSVGGKLRALQGLLGFVPPPPGREETVRQFFRRQLGSEVAERLVEPFTSGVYAGDPDQLSAVAAFPRVAGLEERYGSLFAGALQALRQRPQPSPAAIQPPPKRGQLGNLRQGLQQLPEALAQKLGDSLRLGWRALQLKRAGELYWVGFETPEGSRWVAARQVVLALPAYEAAALLQELNPPASQLLAEILYPPVAVVALAYPQEALPQPLRGFGHLIPRSQGLRTLGTIWASCLFPERAPQGYHSFLSFLGGATDAALARQQGIPPIPALSPEERAQIAHAELSQVLLTRRAEPVYLGERLWPRAIPQYTLGHRQRIAQVQAHLASQTPGIWVCANYLDGVALGDCVRRAEALAQQLLSQV